MKRQLQRKLEQEFRRKGEELAKAVVSEGQPATLKDGVVELENYSKLLTLTASRWTADSWVAALVALFCVAVGAALWSVKVSSTSISLSLDAETLQGKLTKTWHTERPFTGSLVHIEGINHIEAPNLGAAISTDQGNAWLRLDGGRVTLETLNVGEGSNLQITSDENEVSIFVGEKPLQGRIVVIGKGTITAGTGSEDKSVARSYDLPVPETIDFEAKTQGVVPSRLTFHHPEKWDLGRVPITNLDFNQETARNLTETFTSTVKSGSIRFLDTSWPAFVIGENQVLALDGTDRASVEVHSAPSSIHITVNGVVGSVITGATNDHRKLAPSYLEYFYSNRTLTFFWGAVVFSWGVLWGIRKTVFR